MADLDLSRAFYARINPLFTAHLADAIDQQSDFAERLELVLTLVDEKPSFFAFAGEPTRRELFRQVSEALTEFGSAVGLFWGTDEGRFHTAHRELNLAIPDLAPLIASRHETQPLFWASRSSTFATAYRAGAANDIGEVNLLGYPACCAAWHYDTFFARHIEAFVEVYRRHATPAQLRDHFNGWTPTPGEFFPSDLGAAALFRSNAVYPYIAHVACPRCLRDATGPSARQNAAASALGEMLDPETHAEVQAETTVWGKRVPAMVSNWRRDLEDGAARLSLDVASRDSYLRLGRHWFRALGFN